MFDEMIESARAGPPCQPFSKSSYWRSDTKRLRDPRARTLFSFLDYVEELQPSVFMLENTQGFGYIGKDEGLKLIERRIRRINKRTGSNYRVNHSVLNAAEYGVPQIRTRFFLVSHRDGLQLKFPTPTHAKLTSDSSPPNNNNTKPMTPFTTAWDAIGRLESCCTDSLKMRGIWAELLPSIPEGRNYLWHTNRGEGFSLFGWRTRYWSFLLKLAKAQPSWTIQASAGPATGPFHWSNRQLSTDEVAALQTFPQTFVFKGARKSIIRQIGNAVPCLLGEVIGREIGKQFFGKKIRVVQVSVSI